MMSEQSIGIIATVCSTFIAGGALLFSVYCIRYTKINISVLFRNDIIKWHNQCLEIMMKLKNCNLSDDEYEKLMSNLSALVDAGRMFFPNVQKESGYGKDNPPAFQGLRCYILDYLVLYYRICEKNKDNLPVYELEKIHRNFTSSISEFLKPDDYIKTLNKVLQSSYIILEREAINKSQYLQIEESVRKNHVNI